MPLATAPASAQGAAAPAATAAAKSASPAAATATQTANATTAATAAGTAANPVAKAPTSLVDPAAAASFDINGKAYVLYDAQSGVFLMGRNPDAPLSPASITKVMTVLLALEKMKLGDVLTITRDMFATIPNDYVRLGLVEGEQISVEEALYASLLISANDASMALALTMGGTAEGFAAMMNARAAELGCTGTRFTNPYGYADPNNLTTAHDMALIMAEALKSETYTRIATTQHHMVPATNKAKTRGLTNGNRFVSSSKYAFPPYIGGKTGFTNLSGHTIAAGARKDGRTLVAVILGATASEIRYANLVTLFNHGFTAYSTTRVDPAAYEPFKDQVSARLQSDIASAGLALAVAKVSLELAAFASTTKARGDKGFTAAIGDGLPALQDGLASQVVRYPLYRQYGDGTRSPVGTLSVTVEAKAKPTTARASETVVANVQPGASAPSAGSIVGRILLGVFAAFLLMVVVVGILMVREKQRRAARRRRPKIRRL